MANIYKKINTDLITTEEKVAYTVPSNSRALIKSIHIFNEGAGAAALQIKIKDGTSATTYFYDKTSLAADANEEFINNVLILQESDELRFLSDISGPDVIISLLEINREDR